MSPWAGRGRFVAEPPEELPPAAAGIVAYDFTAVQHPNGQVRCGNCNALILECLDGSACFRCRRCHVANRIDTGCSA